MLFSGNWKILLLKKKDTAWTSYSFSTKVVQVAGSEHFAGARSELIHGRIDKRFLTMDAKVRSNTCKESMQSFIVVSSNAGKLGDVYTKGCDSSFDLTSVEKQKRLQVEETPNQHSVCFGETGESVFWIYGKQNITLVIMLL